MLSAMLHGTLGIWLPWHLCSTSFYRTCACQQHQMLEPTSQLRRGQCTVHSMRMCALTVLYFWAQRARRANSIDGLLDTAQHSLATCATCACASEKHRGTLNRFAVVSSTARVLRDMLSVQKMR